MEEALNLSRAGVILDQLSPELIKGRNVQALHLHMGTAHQVSVSMLAGCSWHPVPHAQVAPL